MVCALKCAVHIGLLAALASCAPPEPVISGNGACDSSNENSCCKVDGKYCTRISVNDIKNVPDGVCLWSNLAGQTPNINPELNFPYLNNFACGMDSTALDTDTTLPKYPTEPGCNFQNTAAVIDQPTKVYYGLVANISQKDVAATNSAGYYKNFNVALSRYNCEEQYSHWNCDDCRKAYARWVCAISMPACNPTPCSKIKPWQFVCNQVVQMCPVTLGFTCPTVTNNDHDYLDTGGNYMGLPAGASKTSSSAFAMTVTAALIAWLNFFSLRTKCPRFCVERKYQLLFIHTEHQTWNRCAHCRYLSWILV